MDNEERMYAISDHNAEQQGEGHATGRAEVVHEIYEYFKNTTQHIWSTEEILKIISDFDD